MTNLDNRPAKRETLYREAIRIRVQEIKAEKLARKKERSCLVTK
jgi:uncharacterized protein YaiL (DUF2058 family)